MLSNILVEFPWNTLMAALIFVCWYYPTGWQQTVQPEHERGFLCVPIRMDVHAVHQHLQSPRRRRYSNCGDSRQHCEHMLYALHRILRVSPTSL